MGICKYLIIRKNGYLLRFHPSSLSAANWVGTGERKDDEQFFEDYLKPGDTFIDIGANIGSNTIVGSRKVGPSGVVHSFEPHPTIYSFLIENILLNSLRNVKVYNIALGDRNGFLYFLNQKSDDQNRVIDYRESKGTESIKVLVDTLDNVIGSDKNEIALIKIDVEGYELLVLHGATEILHHVKCIYFESWEKHFERFGYTCHDIFIYLINMGFSLWNIDTLHKIIRPVMASYTSVRCENILALRNVEEFVALTGYKKMSAEEIKLTS